MSFVCKSDVIEISDLFNYYKKKQITKPKLQRKQCWVEKDISNKGSTNNYDFIQFILKTRNIVNPLLLHQKYIRRDTVNYIVIDGNNRINAIIKFILNPLELFDDLIDENFTEEMKKKLKECDLETLLKARDIRHLCVKIFKDNTLFEENQKKFPDNDNDNDNNIYDAFDNLNDELNALDFFRIKIPITIFNDISEKEICEIYEGVNKGGMKLTRQEILASTTSFNTYTNDELDNYNVLKNIITKYYDDMNDNELLNINTHNDSLNLYEILLATQINFHHIYKNLKLVEEPGKSTLDIIFKLYEIIFSSFDDKNNVNDFLKNISTILDYIKNIYTNYIFNTTIEFKQILTYSSSLSKNAIIILIIDCYKNFDKISNNDKIFMNKITKLLVFSELINTLPDKEIKKDFDNHDLNYSKTRFTKKYARNILTGKQKLNSASDEEIKNLFYKNIELQLNEIKENSRRKPLTKFKIIILSLYFNKCVPQYLLTKNKNNDHIIPFSSKKNNKNIDIDRLGNLVLIDSDTNKKKGVKIINDKFINDNKLNYYNYPSDNEVKKIINNKKEIISEEKYNIMCLGREELYIQEILKLLS